MRFVAAANPSLLAFMTMLAGAAALGLVSAFFGPSTMEPGVMAPLDWWRPSGWSPETAWHRVLGLWIGPWGAALTLAILVASLRLSRLARGLRPLDLFDRRPLAPFVAQALTLYARLTDAKPRLVVRNQPVEAPVAASTARIVGGSPLASTVDTHTSTSRRKLFALRSMLYRRQS